MFLYEVKWPLKESLCWYAVGIQGGKCRVVKPEIVGHVLMEYRERKGLTQDVLSGLAGLDRTHYSKLERGLRSPTLDTLFKIGHALDVPPHIILKSIEEAHLEVK